MGGNIAGGLSVLNDIEGVTFNPYGNLNDILQQKANDLNQTIEINPYKLINYRHEDDWLSKQEHVGSNQILKQNDVAQNPIKNIWNNKVAPHLIPNIPNVNEKNLENDNISNDKTIYYPKHK